jgi:hypothetical protein
MKKKWPKTYAYFKRFETQLRKRSGFQQYFRPDDPFYSVYNVGPYTLAPWKVQWKHTGVQNYMRACVTDKNYIPDQKVIFVEFSGPKEAHYFCACINSLPAFAVIKNYIGLDASPHVLEAVAIPAYNANDPLHGQLTDLSQRCHKAAAQGNTEEVGVLEEEIDKAAAKLWGITNEELKGIRQSVNEAEERSGTESDDQDEQPHSPAV